MKKLIEYLEDNLIQFNVLNDEVIEIDKEYGTDSSSSFVNGVIGSALKEKENEHKKS